MLTGTDLAVYRPHAGRWFTGETQFGKIPEPGVRADPPPNPSPEPAVEGEWLHAGDIDPFARQSQDNSPWQQSQEQPPPFRSSFANRRGVAAYQATATVGLDALVAVQQTRIDCYA